MSDHFYTIDEQGENCYRWGYGGEGITGYVYRNKPSNGSNFLIPIYRFFNSQTGDHFYTRDLNGELAPKMGYVKEGDVAWWMYSQPVPAIKTVALHRWWSGAKNDHFYTTDPKGELALFSGYTYDGVLGCLEIDPSSATVSLRRYWNGSPPLPQAIWSQYITSVQSGKAVTATSVDPRSNSQRTHFRLYCNGRVLDYAMQICGTQGQPVTGFPLYICFHGGGTNTNSAPNANDSSWWDVFDRFYQTPVAAQAPCVFVAARGISAYDGVNVDTYDLHSQPESYILLQQMIMDLILPKSVESSGTQSDKAPTATNFIDPNKVYLLGFSAGGNGIYQLSTKISDRCAAVVSGGGHPEGALFENLANLPIKIQVGGDDRYEYPPNVWTPRPPANLAVDKRLEDLQTTFGSSLYTHQTDIIQAGDHNSWAQPTEVDVAHNVFNKPRDFLVNGQWDPPATASTISAAVTSKATNPEKWVAGFSRYPFPSTVVWNLASRPPIPGSRGPVAASPGNNVFASPYSLLYWLYIRDQTTLDYNPTDVIQASYGMTITKNWIKILKPVQYLGFLLNTHMVNFSVPLEVFDYSGNLIGSVTLDSPSNNLITETLAARGDPFMVFSKMVYLERAGGTSWTVRTTNTLNPAIGPTPKL